MAVYNFPSDAPFTPANTWTDSTPLNLGTRFGLTSDISITGVRFYIPSGTSTGAGQLWAGGVKVAEKTGATLNAGWNTILFDIPYAGTTGVDYVASVLQDTGTARYSARPNTFTDGTDAVLVTVGPAYSNTTENGEYTYSTGSPVPPSSVTTGNWYGLDVVMDDGASPDAIVAAVMATASASGAIPAVSGTSPGFVVAVRATASASAKVPVAAAGVSVAVTAVKATASGSAPIGVVEVVQTLSGGGTATASASAKAPSVTAGGNVTVVLGVVAQATASAKAGVTAIGGAVANGTVVAVRANATASAGTPEARMVETMPTNVGYGRITGRFATAEVLVGDADGLPNLFPITTRTVTFTSTAPVLRNPTASPAPVVIEPAPIVCALDASGYLVDAAGHRWIDLIATDDADLLPSPRKWTVTPSTGFKWSSFQISVAASSEVDLSTLIPT